MKAWEKLSAHLQDAHLPDLSRASGIPRRSLQGCKDGHCPSLERAEDICKALGIELYIGPPRTPSLPENLKNAADFSDSGAVIPDQPLVLAGGRGQKNPADFSEIAAALGLPEEALAADIVASIEELLGRLVQSESEASRWQEVRERLDAMQLSDFQGAMAEVLQELAETRAALRRSGIREVSEDYLLSGSAGLSGVSDSGDALAESDEAAVRYLDVVELAAAAGSGAESLDETVTGRIGFRRQWLERHGIEASQCVLIGVRGESMEPTLPEGCSILVDRSRRRRQDDGCLCCARRMGLW